MVEPGKKGKLLSVQMALMWSLVFGAVGVVAALLHEPSSSEANMWLLMGRGDPIAALDLSGSLGIAPLWFFLNTPLAKLGAPILTQQLLSVVIMGVAVFLLLRSARLHPLTILLFVVGYHAAFGLTVVATGGSLFVVLLFAAASLYLQRERRPFGFLGCLSLLAQTGLCGWLVAGLLGAAMISGRLRRRESVTRWREQRE